MAKATLYLGRLTAVHTSGEWSKDEVFMEVWEGPAGQQVKVARWPDNDRTVQMGDGAAVYADVALRVDYQSQVTIKVRERDSSSNDDANSTVDLAVYELDRRSAASGLLSDTGPNKTRYDLSYRLITNPIPTLRILGIKCEKQTDDIDGETAHKITGAVSACCDAAAYVIDKSPRPRAKLIADAFDAAGAVLDGIGAVAGWLAAKIDGKDDVYLVHYTSSSASADIDGRFFPKQNEEKTTHQMAAEDTVFFEQLYGEYFRFPLDQEDVTVEFREHDAIGKDISICTVTVPRVTSDTDPRLDGPAVEVVADTYDLRGDGKDGVYHMCYSVGMEDWALPASADAQGAPPDPPSYAPTTDAWSPLTPLGAEPMGSAPFACRRGSDIVLFAQMPIPATSPLIYTPRYCVSTGGADLEWLPIVPDAQAGLGSVPTTRPAAAIWSSGAMVVLSVWDVGVVRQYSYQGGTWSLTRVPSEHATSDSPGLASPGEPRLDMFIMAGQGSVKELLRCSFEHATSPASWELVNCHGVHAPAAVTSWPRIDLVHVDDRNELCHHIWDGSAWTRGGAGGGLIHSAPALASRGPGRLDCVARGPHDQLLHRVYQNGAWGPWYEVHGAQRFQGDPAIVATADGGLEVILWSLDGTACKTSLPAAT